MICKNCKKEIPDKIKFCPECGFLNQNKYINKTLPSISDTAITPPVNPTPVIPTPIITPPAITTSLKTDDTMELPSVPLDASSAIAADKESEPDKKSALFSFIKKPLIIIAVALLLLVVGIIANSQKENNLTTLTDQAQEEDDSILSDHLKYEEDDSDPSDSETNKTSQDEANDEKDMFFMPDVINEDIDTATNILTEKGLIVATEHIQTDDYTENTVINQSILPGSEATPGDVVSLVVASKTPTIQSISVVGKKQDDAVTALEEQGFNVIIMDMYDSDVPAGEIISQHPEGGSSQASGSDIVIYVSKGADTIKMPNVVNKHIDDAESILSSKGLYVNIEYEKTDSVKIDYVISQSVKKGKGIERGASITLVVASGRETIDVANVVGKTRASAEEILSDQSFYIHIVEKYDSNVQKGYVISQSPAANSAQLPDTVVTIYVSKGKQPVTVYFNANGGSTSTSSKTVYLTDSYGSLPTPTRNGYTFNGWYTATTGGQKITSSSTVSSASNHTLYAAWTLNQPSDWVLESEVPAGSDILSTRYVYDKTTRETKTSTSSSLSGWTRYDKKTETIYKNVTYYNYVVYGLYHNGDYTYAFSSNRDDIISHCKKSFNYDPYAVCYKITYSTTSKLQTGVKGNYSGCTATSLNGKKSATISIKNTVLFENGTSTKKVASGTKTTYYYERYTTENNLISDSYPTSSSSNVTISNVRKQVKYRAK